MMCTDSVSGEENMQEQVVFIDDDTTFLSSMKRTFRGMVTERTVRFFSDSHDALEHLLTLDSAVVVVDWMMPGMDGIALCKALFASMDKYPEKFFYTIMLTGRKSGTDAAEALTTGLADYLAKPFDNVELQARIDVGVRALGREMALHAARRTLEETLAARSRFISYLSHELRTPIGAVSSLSELLADTALDKEQRELLGMINSSSQTALTLLSDILDLAKLEAGGMTVESLLFDVAALLQDVRSVTEISARKKGLEYSINIDDAIPATIEGDPARIKQVLVNFVSNAVKFTNDGTVRISVKSVTDASGASAIRFDVRDTGIGIDEEAKSRLFTPYVQANQQTYRRFGGTGLGLAICKQLVMLWGGDIGVSSERRQGATFWFTVPVK
jgi:signal transduction histidine kinase